MDSTVRFILGIIAYVLRGGTAPEQPQKTDWEKVYQIAVSQAVISMVSYGVILKNYEMDDAMRNRFIEKMYASIGVDQKQRKSCEALFRAFEDAGLDYLPLKGIVLKEIYPEPEMRRMSDVDILIREERFSEYQEALLQLGYTFRYQSNHEYVFHKENGIAVELHKYLIPSYNDDFYSYYQSGWDIAKKMENQTRWEFTPEDFYVYLLVHFAKHYRDAGAGMKYVLDLWLWQETYTLNWDYIGHQLETLNLKQFWQHLNRLIAVWFEGEETDTLMEDMTAFIMESGQYGTAKNAGNAKFLRLSKNHTDANRHKLWHLLFPNRETMVAAYPRLKKHSWMLPFCWVHRQVCWLLFRRHTFRAHTRALELVNDEGMEQFLAHMNQVGLDIYNGRK